MSICAYFYCIDTFSLTVWFVQITTVLHALSPLELQVLTASLVHVTNTSCAGDHRDATSFIEKFTCRLSIMSIQHISFWMRTYSPSSYWGSWWLWHAQLDWLGALCSDIEDIVRMAALEVAADMVRCREGLFLLQKVPFVASEENQTLPLFAALHAIVFNNNDTPAVRTAAMRVLVHIISEGLVMDDETNIEALAMPLISDNSHSLLAQFEKYDIFSNIIVLFNKVTYSPFLTCITLFVFNLLRHDPVPVLLRTVASGVWHALIPHLSDIHRSTSPVTSATTPSDFSDVDIATNQSRQDDHHIALHKTILR